MTASPAIRSCAGTRTRTPQASSTFTWTTPATPATPTWTATSSQTPATCTASRRANAAGLSDQSSYFNAKTPAAPATVEVEAVPIVVTSTTDDYFVLYVQHQWDENTSVELPVLVKEGEAGTTTLAENLEALPKERYRVEKYLIASPADIDGDGIDDISDPNPVNPAPAIGVDQRGNCIAPT